jgi:hypothetical protein
MDGIWARRTTLLCLLLPLSLHAIGFLMPLVARKSFEQHYIIIHKVSKPQLCAAGCCHVPLSPLAPLPLPSTAHAQYTWLLCGDWLRTHTNTIRAVLQECCLVCKCTTAHTCDQEGRVQLTTCCLCQQARLSSHAYSFHVHTS